MKNILAILLISGMFIGCSNSAGSSEQESGITISGTVINAPAGLIVLERLTQTAAEPMDTVIVNDDNTYSLGFTGAAGFYRINFFNQRVATLILDQDDITIDFDGSSEERTVSPAGSREITTIENFYKEINEVYGPREESINVEFQQAVQAGDTEKQDKIRDDYMALQKEKQGYSADLIRQYEVNLATFQLQSILDMDNYLELKDSLVTQLNTKYPGRFYIEELMTNIEKAKATAVGRLAPEISLPNPEGEVIALSSLKGQVVLVDFWAQWCKPCRQENPNVVKAFNKFKDKGFTVYGVSLDRTHDKWTQAIEEDGLTWTHVSDLKYFQSIAAEAYGVNAIPFSILLDREGKIIAKNLRGKVLEDTLEDYFEKEGRM